MNRFIPFVFLSLFFQSPVVADEQALHPITPATVASYHELKLTPHIEKRMIQGHRVPLAVGSGLVAITSDDESTIILGLADRGPNAAIDRGESTGSAERVVFPDPDYSPTIYPFSIRGSKVDSASALLRKYIGLSRESRFYLRSMDGAPLSGLPVSDAEEAPVDFKLSGIPTAKPGRGIDPEAMAFDPAGRRIWIAEEYGPSILEFDLATWRTLRTWSPGSELPEILRYRAPNRGFEGLTFTARGELAAILQSPLRDPQRGAPEKFVRLLMRNVAAGRDLVDSRPWLTYPLLPPADAAADSYKIGELVALKDGRFLALESFKTTDEEKRYHIILLDIQNSTPIESNRLLHDYLHIKTYVERSVVLDFKDFKWDSGKIEGMTLLNSSRTLLISKDNDFGLKLGSKDKKDASKEVEISDVPTDLLLIQLPEAIERILRANVIGAAFAE